MIFRRITLILILSFAACASFYAQKGWGIEGSAFLSSPYGNYIADLGVTHYWNFMKYGTIGMGAKFSYVNTSNLGEWYTDTERYAFNDDENFLVSLDGVTTIGCYIPVLKQTGVFCDASVTFSLIPIDWIDIKKYNHDNPINYELHSISAFNHFSPKTFLGLGVYYDIKQDDAVSRLLLGYGYGYYDAFRGCRHATFDGQYLGDHIPRAKYIHRITLKFIIFQ